LTWDGRSVNRDVRTRDLVRSKSPKISYRLIQYGLEVSTQLIIALSKRWVREDQKKQDRKCREHFLEHDALESQINVSDVEAEEGLSPTLEACLLALCLVNQSKSDHAVSEKERPAKNNAADRSAFHTRRSLEL